MRLQVAADHRTLQNEGGKPFFTLADTAWNLFQFLTREEADFYLQTRAAQGFTVIQAVALFEQGQPSEPNRNGDASLLENDPTRPNEAFWQHLDWVIDRAAELGLWIGFLPTWGDKWNCQGGAGPEIFNPENARIYGEWIGKRYAQKPVIWILGGDRAIEKPEHVLVMRAMAAGIEAGDGGRGLKTFHPPGGVPSSRDLHQEKWLDFNMIQSGHTWKGADNGALIAADYALKPTKPVLDAEPCYEEHPVMGIEWEGLYDSWFDERDVRQSAYQAVLSGACGHTYGCHNIWQFVGATTRAPISHARRSWKESLFLPGATQMRHFRALFEPIFAELVPAPELIGVCDVRLTAARTGDGSRVLVYFPRTATAMLQLITLCGENFRARWFNPRTGLHGEPETFARPRSKRFPDQPRRVFEAPDGGEDWVLDLEIS